MQSMVCLVLILMIVCVIAQPQCDLCGELFDAQSDFMQKCGGHLRVNDLRFIKRYCDFARDNERFFQFFIESTIDQCEFQGFKTFEAPKCDCKCTDIDLVFVLDASASMGNGFLDARQFIFNVVAALTVEPGCTQVGLIRFTNGSEVVLSLPDGDNKMDIRSTISDLQLPKKGRHGSDIGEALNDMIEEFSLNGRPSALQVGVLLTDGKIVQDFRLGTNEDVPDLAVAAPALRMIAVGVGADADQAVLMNIASGSGNDNVLTVDEFNRVLDIVPELTSGACIKCVPGRTWTPDECTICTCLSNGEAECVTPPSSTLPNCLRNIWILDECGMKICPPCTDGIIPSTDQCNELCTCDQDTKEITCPTIAFKCFCGFDPVHCTCDDWTLLEGDCCPVCPLAHCSDLFFQCPFILCAPGLSLHQDPWVSCCGVCV